MFTKELYFHGVSYTTELVATPWCKINPGVHIVKPNQYKATSLNATILHKTAQRSTLSSKRMRFMTFSHWTSFLRLHSVSYTAELISYLNITANICQNFKKQFEEEKQPEVRNILTLSLSCPSKTRLFTYSRLRHENHAHRTS